MGKSKIKTTTVYLSAPLAAQLARVAKRAGISQSTIIRRGVRAQCLLLTSRLDNVDALRGKNLRSRGVQKVLEGIKRLEDFYRAEGGEPNVDSAEEKQ